MKKLFVGILFMSLAVTVANAQESKPQKHKMHRKSHHGLGFQKLNFTEDQKGKMKSIDQDFRKQMSELKKNDNITVKEYRSRMDAIRKEYRQNIQGVMTTEQKDQLVKMRDDAKAHQKEHAQARAEKMQKELSLTEEQSAKLKQLHTTGAEKMKTIRDDSSLSTEEKKTRIKEMRKAQKEEMKSLLTAEQVQKMEEMKKSRHGRWSK